jgi:GTP-binding protein Era
MASTSPFCAAAPRIELTVTTLPNQAFHCGTATLHGAPNAGKSTLLNRLVGEKLAIVSAKPQTTREPIRGVWTGADMQVAFIDTPGIHKARSPLNRAMVGLAIGALETVDVVVLVVDGPRAARWVEHMGAPRQPEPGDDDDDEVVPEPASEKWRQPLDSRLHPSDRRVLREVLRYGKQCVVALNKVDAIAKPKLLPVMAAWATVPDLGPVIPISARTGDGVQPLLAAIRARLPAGELLWPADELTDKSLRFLCAELVREQVFVQIQQEVPYGVACETEQWQDEGGLTRIAVVVHVEKPAQRAILVGKGGARMKAMATAARTGMEKLLDRKVFLEVHVRVEPRWSERVDMLRRFGYVL